MNPGLTIGPITLYYYGLILGLAIVVGFLYARSRAAPRAVPAALIDALLIWAVPLAIIGARLYFVLFNLQDYLVDPVRIIRITEGGLAIHGALIGGLLGALIALWRTKTVAPSEPLSARFAKLADVVAPALLLSQAIGRLANYVNQEAFGRPTTLPWGISIDPGHRPPEYLSAERFHPTFAYEALWNLLGLVVLLWLERRLRRRHAQTGGVLFAAYLAWYSFGRFWIEFLRTDALMFGPLRIAQVISAVALVGSLGFIWYRVRRWKT